jgi:hypothetical protein
MRAMKSMLIGLAAVLACLETTGSIAGLRATAASGCEHDVRSRTLLTRVSTAGHRPAL